MKRFTMLVFVAALVLGFSLSAAAVTLTMSVNGDGTTDPPVGVHEYAKKAKVTCTAFPADGWEFVNWTGSLTSTSNPVQITLTSNKSLTANFVQAGPTMYTLTTSVVGQGTVTPTGVNQYASGTIVDVSAQPVQGWEFDHWEGALTGSTNPTTILMDANKAVTGVFVETAPVMYTLTTSVVGSGTVTPAGVNQYASGTIVNVSAQAAQDWAFDHWEGALTGSTNPTTILMDANKAVTGVFIEDTGPDPSTALHDFINAPDPNYSWTQYHSSIAFGYTNYFIDMNSQQWRTAQEVDRPIWQHYLIIQKGWFTGSTAIMLIDGGSNGGTPPTTADDTLGLMSLLTGFPVADLKQCPNQPLYFTDEVGVARHEDDLLAYSFNKFMLTGDPTWNGHLPMTKAAIRGLDTIQAKIGCSKFIVAGASKRGWTTWLTAATDDPRIIAYMPIVIPILNCGAQMVHHWESYGFYSFAVSPYLEFDLFCVLDTPRGQDWLTIEDPYSYLATSSTIANKPKLLINASGDEFFMPDALQFYWNAIPGPGQKHVRILPNASHGMDQGTRFDDALATGMAWAGNVKNNNPNPVYSWSVGPNGITVTCGSTPSSVLLWQATNPVARDFRIYSDDGVIGLGEAYTSSALANQGNNTFVGYCPPPAQGWTAYFVEVNFGSDHIYTSEVVITPNTLPFAGTACL